MRNLVQKISVYAKGFDPNFIVIPQNGVGLICTTGDDVGLPDVDYFGRIEGFGQEDLYYGYDADDRPTPSVLNAEKRPRFFRLYQQLVEQRVPGEPLELLQDVFLSAVHPSVTAPLLQVRLWRIFVFKASLNLAQKIFASAPSGWPGRLWDRFC